MTKKELDELRNELSIKAKMALILRWQQVLFGLYLLFCGH